MLIAEKCANRSSPPPSGVMKPKPFASLNHLTVPVAILPIPLGFERGVWRADSALSGAVVKSGSVAGRSRSRRTEGTPNMRFLRGLLPQRQAASARTAFLLKKLLQSSNIDPKSIRSIVEGHAKPG